MKRGEGEDERELKRERGRRGRGGMRGRGAEDEAALIINVLNSPVMPQK